MRKIKTNQNGSSMIEMLGVLTIVGMVGLGIVKIVSSVYNMFTQNMIVTEARDLQKSISDRYRFEGNYTTELFNGRDCFSAGSSDDAVATFICNNKLAPFQMCSSGKMYHRGGGRVKICKHADNDKYYMIFYGLNDTACAALAQVNWYTRQKSDVVQMVINADVAGKTTTIDSSYIPGDHGDNIFPVSTAKAVSACNNGNDNTVQWTFF